MPVQANTKNRLRIQELCKLKNAGSNFAFTKRKRMKITKTIIFSTIAAMAAMACKNQPKEQVQEVEQKTEITIQQPATEKNDFSFQKTLQLKNISFDVTTKGNGSLRQLLIQPKGLEINNDSISREIDGSVTDAQVSDLNADGFPELLIFTQSAGSGSYGDVIAYSVNAGKSMSQVSFTAASEDPKINKGYMGHDHFSVNGSNLIQEFPIYKENDPNSNPTGGKRRIQYKLVNGEASRKFVVDKTEDKVSN